MIVIIKDDLFHDCHISTKDNQFYRELVSTSKTLKSA